MAEFGARIASITHRATSSIVRRRGEPADRIGGLRAFALAGNRSEKPLQPWQMIAGAGAVLLPGTILALFGRDLPVSTPGVIFLFAIALSAYLAGWTGGGAALIVSALWLDFFFVGERAEFGGPESLSEALTFASIIAAGLGLIMLIERVKSESAVDRREAMAARAATAALSTLEAATRSDAEIASEQRAMEILLEAMTRANRAHGGIVLLYDEARGTLTRIAQYGINDEGMALPQHFPVDIGFAGRLALERRPAMVERLSKSPLVNDPILAYLGFESALGVPLATDDALLGVAIIGLLLPHRFTAIEAARAEAIASRAAALLRAARAGDARAMQLQRATDARDRLRELIQAMPEAVLLVAPPDGRVLLYNSAAVHMLGALETSGPLSDISNRILTPDGAPADPAGLPHIVALRSGEVVDSIELLVRLGDGRETPVLASAAPLRELDRSIAAVVLVLRDIRALKDATKMKDEFVSVVSHELRSPMTPISGFVQLVTRDLIREGGHDQQVKWLQSVSGHIDRMTRLVEDLLEVSRLKSGSLDIKLEPTDIVSVCEDVATSRQASAPGHSIRFNYRGGSVIGEWDHDRLHQVVDNLVGNGIKYSPPGSAVTIDLAVEHLSKYVVLTVSDEGPGIPPEDRDRIFTAFYRTREAELSQIAGLGLGLYIVGELVAAHGGEVRVDESPSGGAAFHVFLPMTQMSAAA